MNYSDSALSLLCQLIGHSATLDQASAFLADHGLPYSASSWDAMIEERLKPAVRERGLPIAQLLQLLRDTEEYGHQHVFLYSCSRQRAKYLMTRNRVETALSGMGAQDVLDRPLIVEHPTSPQLVDVRWEKVSGTQHDTLDGEDSLILKFVETREKKELLQDVRHGNEITKTWRVQKIRAVNVFQLHASGLLELRIYSHRSSRGYAEEIERMWRHAARVLPRVSGGQVRMASMPITKAKEAIWQRKGSLANEIRYCNSSFRSTSGTTLSAATGAEDSTLFDDPAADSLDAFRKSGAACEAIVVQWVGRNEGNLTGPSTTTYLRLSGEINEYSLSARCSKVDHRFLLGKMVTHNA